MPFPPQNDPSYCLFHRSKSNCLKSVGNGQPFFAERGKVKFFRKIRKNFTGLDSIKNSLLMLPFKVGCVTVPTILRCAGWWWGCCCNNDGQHWHDFHEVERDPQDVVSASPCSGIWLFYTDYFSSTVVVLWSRSPSTLLLSIHFLTLNWFSPTWHHHESRLSKGKRPHEVWSYWNLFEYYFWVFSSIWTFPINHDNMFINILFILFWILQCRVGSVKNVFFQVSARWIFILSLLVGRIFFLSKLILKRLWHPCGKIQFVKLPLFSAALLSTSSTLYSLCYTLGTRNSTALKVTLNFIET